MSFQARIAPALRPFRRHDSLKVNRRLTFLPTARGHSSMRWSIRWQLLVPLLILLLGVVAISTWTAFASAQHARDRIETQLRNFAQTANQVTLPRHPEILKWLHDLSEAEFIRAEPDGSFESSLNLKEWPESLPEPLDDWRQLQLGTPVRIGDLTYLASGVRLRDREGVVLYILYPKSL